MCYYFYYKKYSDKNLIINFVTVNILIVTILLFMINIVANNDKFEKSHKYYTIVTKLKKCHNIYIKKLHIMHNFLKYPSILNSFRDNKII